MSSYSGKVLDSRYKLLRQVATGGMGEVWTARDSVSGRHIAVKILKPELAGQDTFLQRLRMEARNAMQIEHPNLAAVLDHGEEDGLGWIVMEYVEGRPFNEYLRDGNRISPDQLIPVLIQTAYALQAAHSREVVHRDIKPSNLIITPEGFVKLTDFGISVTPNQATMTEAGMVMGTAQYLPPEQAMGEPATHAGDLYALGVIAYEALAGRRPFTGKTQVDVAFAHVNDPVPPLPEDVPEELARVVMHLLRKKPSDRPKDGTALARELAAVARALDIDTAPKPVSLPDSASAERPVATAAVDVIDEEPPKVADAKREAPAGARRDVSAGARRVVPANAKRDSSVDANLDSSIDAKRDSSADVNRSAPAKHAETSEQPRATALMDRTKASDFEASRAPNVSSARVTTDPATTAVKEPAKIPSADVPRRSDLRTDRKTQAQGERETQPERRSQAQREHETQPERRSPSQRRPQDQRKAQAQPELISEFRHAQDDPHSLPLRDLAVVAVVVLALFLLIWWLTQSPANATNSLQDIVPTSNPGNLADSTFMEVSAWLTTSTTA
ncbi:MAG: protein kinase domain-containing protein [Gleimia sp.]|jgi:serine/threonine protein kinase